MFVIILFLARSTTIEKASEDKKNSSQFRMNVDYAEKLRQGYIKQKIRFQLCAICLYIVSL